MPTQKTSVFEAPFFEAKMLPSEDVPPFGIWRPPSFGDRCVDVVDELWLPRAPVRHRSAGIHAPTVAANVMDAMSTISRDWDPPDVLDSWGSKWSSSAYKNILDKKDALKKKQTDKRNNLDKFWYFMIFPPTWNKGSFQVTCRSKWRDDSLATKLLSRGEVVQWPCLKIVFLRPWRTCYFGFGKDCRRRIMGIYK